MIAACKSAQTAVWSSEHQSVLGHTSITGECTRFGRKACAWQSEHGSAHSDRTPVVTTHSSCIVVATACRKHRSLLHMALGTWRGRTLRVVSSLVQLTVGKAESAQASGSILLHVIPGHALHAVIHLIVHCQPLIDHCVCTLHSVAPSLQLAAP